MAAVRSGLGIWTQKMNQEGGGVSARWRTAITMPNAEKQSDSH
jgi:hypothetical protein